MKRKLLIILAFVILGISGCEKNVIDNEKKTSVKNEPVLSNINYYDDKIENEYGDITLFASIKNKNEGYEHVAWTNFLGVNGNKAIIYHNEENGKRYVLRINTDTKAVEETMGLTEDDYAMCINDYILIKHEKYEKNEFNYVLYDYDFNEICRLDVDSSDNGIFLDKNMEKLYYVKDNKLKCMTLGDSKTYDMEVEYLDKIENIDDYGVSNDGREYLILDGCYDNNRRYKIMCDVSTGEIVKLFNETASMYKIEKGNIIMTDYQEDKTVLYDYADENIRYKYVSTVNDAMTNYKILSDGRVVAVNLIEGKASLFAFDNNNLAASTDVAIEDCLVNGGVLDLGDLSDTYLSCDIFEILGGDIVFFVECEDYSYYFKWTPQGENITNEEVEISDFSVDELFFASTGEEILNYFPGELSDNLKSLREKADDIEEKYDIDIKIGEESRGKYEQYLVGALIDYDFVNDALFRLDEQLGRYPDGFFKQFKDETYDGISVVLSGAIETINNEFVPVGFEISDYDVVTIDVDITYPEDFVATFNHEMCHAIESIIYDRWILESENNSDENNVEDYSLSDEKWKQFNPVVDDSIYTYDYNVCGYDKYEQFYNEWMGYEELYFTRGYGMTYPNEDRATIFEEVMSGNCGIDLDRATHIKEKLNYYCKCIRDSFDTTGWENVPWERYYIDS